MKRYTALLAALCCLLALACAGCAHYGNRLPETSPNAESAAETAEPASAAPAASAEPEKPARENEAYAAYLGILTGAREKLLGYDWQKGTIFDEDYYMARPVAPSEQVALVDVWGDETPELLCVAQAENNGDFSGFAQLRVYTYGEDGGVRELFSTTLDGLVAGGMSYRLFQAGTDKGLWLYEAYYDEETEESYRHFAAEGAMHPVLTCKRSSYPVENDAGEWGTGETFRRDGAECTAEAYAEALPAEAEQAKGLLMRNALFYEYMEAAEKPEGAFGWPGKSKAMTCDDAIGQLRHKLGVKSKDMSEEELFASLPESFTFASGAGAWMSELFVKPDGTFTGDYHDSDMGDTGEGYPNGTIYVCSFSGAFGDVKRVNEYTYSMHVKKLDVDSTPAKEWIEDDVRYVASIPYGLENADEVLVYLPGAYLLDLPDEFITWVGMMRAWDSDDRPTTLPFYGLYNVTDQMGWSGSAY